MALPTQPDNGQHRKPKMSATIPEVETESGNSTRPASVCDAILTATPTFSTMAYSEMSLPTRPDIGRHREPEMSATEPEMETGSGNKYERKELAMRFQQLITYFRPYQTQIWHYRHCPRSTDIRNSKCRRKPKVILTSGCPPMSNRVGQCRYCLKVVRVTGKCGVCRWDFANISFHSRDPVYFRFTVRHLEFRMIQASDNVGNGTVELGVVENRG